MNIEIHSTKIRFENIINPFQHTLEEIFPEMTTNNLAKSHATILVFFFFFFENKNYTP